MEELINILSQTFVQRALLGGVVIAIICGILGVYIVLKKESFFSEGIAHGSLAGIALAFLIGAEPLYLAIIVAVIMAIAVIYLKKNTKLSSDSIIGILFTILFALGVVLLNLNQAYRPSLETYLFGNILSIPWELIVIAIILLAGVLFFVIGYYKHLLYVTFDPEAAKIRGVRVEIYDYILSILTAIAIIISVRVVGIILVTALLIIPATTAKLLSRNFAQMIPISIVHNVLAMIIGMLVSTNLPSGPSIVLVSGMIFLVVFLLKKIF